jgi:hypothetical protein
VKTSHLVTTTTSKFIALEIAAAHKYGDNGSVIIVKRICTQLEQ